MRFLKCFAVAFCAMLALSAISSCDKRVEPVKAPVAFSLIQGASAATPAAPTPASTAPTPAATSTPAAAAPTATPAPVAKTDKPKPAKTKAKSKPKPAKADTADTTNSKAAANAERAKCLKTATDYKFAQDQKAGKVTDWGNVRTVGPCQGNPKAAKSKAKPVPGSPGLKTTPKQ